MQQLDLNTVVFLSVLLGPVIALVLVSLRNAYPSSVQGLGWWAIGSAASSVGIFLIFKGTVPGNGAIFGMGAAMVQASSLVWVLGTERFLQVRHSLRFTLPPVLAMFLYIVYLICTTQGLQPMVAPLTLTVGCVHLYHGWVLYRHGEHHFGSRFLLYSLLGLSLCWFARVGFALADPEWIDSIPQTSYSTQLHAALSVLRQLTLIGFVLMASERIRNEFQRLASHDSLTGALLRRSWLLEADREMGRSRRHKRPLTLLAMDLDHFKQINDSLGHAAGDQALIDFVATVSGHLRRQDCLGRIGGEEFVLLLPETRCEEAHQVAERIRAATEGQSGAIRYTVSIGIAELSASDASITALLARADRAMYQAKSLGRNQVVVDTTALATA